jgi:shikimate kinase
LSASPPIHPKLPARLVALTGFMGCGKTTVGRLLARQLGWRPVDLDHRIVETSGLSVPEIFAQLGEAKFRELERSELEQALGEAGVQGRPTVLSLGGGTITRADNLVLLRQSGGVILWLHCHVDDLFHRCAQITNRPLFRDEASFHALYAQRLPFYEAADYRVDSSGDPRNTVNQIMALGILDGVPA